MGEPFEIERGVRQGDPLSPNLLNCILEEAMRSLDWKDRGIKINGEFLNNLRFADNVVLIAGNLMELIQNAEEFLDLCEKGGLTVNTNKTKFLANSLEIETIIRNEKNRMDERSKLFGPTNLFQKFM